MATMHVDLRILLREHTRGNLEVPARDDGTQGIPPARKVDRLQQRGISIRRVKPDGSREIDIPRRCRSGLDVLLTRASEAHDSVIRCFELADGPLRVEARLPSPIRLLA